VFASINRPDCRGGAVGHRVKYMRRLLITAAVACAAVSSVQANTIPSDGKCQKLADESDTFTIKRRGGQSSVERTRCLTPRRSVSTVGPTPNRALFFVLAKMSRLGPVSLLNALRFPL